MGGPVRAMTINTRPWPPAAAAAALGLVVAWWAWPGITPPDSEHMIGQARAGLAGDWHSPALVHLWGWLLSVTGSTGSLLLIQLLPYWAGFGWLAATVQRDRPGAGWLVLLVAVFPLSIWLSRYVLKDVAMQSVMVLAMAAMATHLARQDQGQAGRWRLVLAVVALVAASFMRVNTAFAVGPLLAGLVLGSRWCTVARMSILALPAAALVLGSVLMINQTLLVKRSEDPMQQLQLFDLLGIQRFSGDEGVWGRYDVRVADARHCYSAFHWDTLASWGRCSHLRKRMGATPEGRFGEADIAERGRLWRQAILAHPGSYLEHRLRHLNSSLSFAVPALHVRFEMQAAEGVIRQEPLPTARDVRLDYVKRNVLTWPATWLAIALACLALLVRIRPVGWRDRLAVLLFVSGAAYSLAYGVIGVASQPRYHLWTLNATMLGVLLAWPTLRSIAQNQPHAARWGAGAVAVVVLIGLASRLWDVPFI